MRHHIEFEANNYKVSCQWHEADQHWHVLTNQKGVQKQSQLGGQPDDSEETIQQIVTAWIDCDWPNLTEPSTRSDRPL